MSPLQFFCRFVSHVRIAVVGQPRNARLLRKAPLDVERPASVQAADTDFVRFNALRVIHHQPAEVIEVKEYYLAKPDYGQVPEYLMQAKRKLEEERKNRDAAEARRAQEVRTFQLSSSASLKLGTNQCIFSRWHRSRMQC